MVLSALLHCLDLNLNLRLKDKLNFELKWYKKEMQMQMILKIE